MIAAAPSSAHPPATAYRTLYVAVGHGQDERGDGRRDRERQRVGDIEHGKPVLAPVDGAERGTAEGGSAWGHVGVRDAPSPPGFTGHA